MSKIGGNRREESEGYVKKVGLFEGKVILVNPTREQFKSVLEMDLKEDSSADVYLGTSKDNNKVLRVDFWLAETKEKGFHKVSFFLEDKQKQNKDETKYQFINDVGSCSWGETVDDLPEWFSQDREVRIAYTGEEELYDFMRTWLSGLDYRHADTTLQLEWKKLMKGDVSDIREQIDGEFSKNVVTLATINVKEKDGEIKEYPNIYNRAFLTPFSLDKFKTTDYTNSRVLSILKNKKSRDLKAHERFALKVTGEHGCKDFYILRPLREYDSSENPMASASVLQDMEDEEDVTHSNSDY